MENITAKANKGTNVSALMFKKLLLFSSLAVFIVKNKTNARIPDKINGNMPYPFLLQGGFKVDRQEPITVAN